MPAPELQVSEWLNSAPLTLAGLRGRVVVLHAFQMLCPGCVSHGLPQAMRIRRAFPTDELVVVGLHTVFEHHDVMTPAALRVFVNEYNLNIPIGVDAPGPDGGVPQTMRAYSLRGTPSLVIIDREGRLAENWFGRLDDIKLGAAIAQLVASTPHPQASPGRAERVGADGCSI
jgi:peroxiredoxin